MTAIEPYPTLLIFVNNNGAADSFKSPEGLFVTSSGNIFVADTGNSRIVELDAAGAFIAKLATLGLTMPMKVCRSTPFNLPKLLSIGWGAFMWCATTAIRGLGLPYSDGGFTGFIGAPRVTYRCDLFWYRIATDEQRERMQLFCPLSFVI